MVFPAANHSLQLPLSTEAGQKKIRECICKQSNDQSMLPVKQSLNF